MSGAAFHVIKGRRHQGEGHEGDAARRHALTTHGVIECGAVPRGKGVAKLTTKKAFAAGEFSPACAECLEVIGARRAKR